MRENPAMPKAGTEYAEAFLACRSPLRMARPVFPARKEPAG